MVKESDRHAPNKEVDTDDMTSAGDGMGGEGDSLEDERIQQISTSAVILPSQNIIEVLGNNNIDGHN